MSKQWDYVDVLEELHERLVPGGELGPNAEGVDGPAIGELTPEQQHALGMFGLERLLLDGPPGRLPMSAVDRQQLGRFHEALSTVRHELKAVADEAHNRQLHESENDFAWDMARQIDYQLERLRERLVEPPHARDWAVPEDWQP
jgi:hypothetical protein